MELVTASDLFVTASLAILLSFLVAKLVSLAMTDTHTTTNYHDHDEPVTLQEERFTVQTAQTESRVGFISPVQVTNLETEPEPELPEHNIEETAVESKPDVVGEMLVTSDIAVDVTKEKIADPDDETEEFGPQAVEETRNTEFVEEISVEPSTEKLISVVENDDGNDDDDDDDDWEGIERSELENVFMAASEFVGGGEDNRLSSVGSDVQMELYGLHKVATEGPCRDPQPMPLKLSARAKWNAWQKLGNMSPEVAMEQYISLLSDKVPGWTKYTSAGMCEHEHTAGSEVSESVAPDLSASLYHQQTIVTERELEQEPGAQDRSPLAESDLENNVKK
ncbi:acyl-CoA-binding domain-containing protein 3-like [Gastrolobium bilobum]|uniref:acyl-CoA-binding domain-containing protein 3-like n=1 Tax=Gastrolobium bilobum TaxID=150636 RepID=UPI002AB06BA9|nr:acyl-CoA-binding domain-containing protein 3-like [Gastrolobium bilobum]